MVNDNADLAFEGEIINYVVQPAALQTNDVASLNQLTITINVKYTIKLMKNKVFHNNFLAINSLVLLLLFFCGEYINR